VYAVAVDIAEQVAGITLLPDKDTPEDDEGGPSERQNLSGAWNLASQVHITNVAHLVAQHRPKS
jgi:hypothetical protein